MNKRNAALIQNFMAEELRVPAARGVVRFVGIDESCLASGGVTVLGDIEGAVSGAGRGVGWGKKAGKKEDEGVWRGTSWSLKPRDNDERDARDGRPKSRGKETELRAGNERESGNVSETNATTTKAERTKSRQRSKSRKRDTKKPREAGKAGTVDDKGIQEDGLGEVASLKPRKSFSKAFHRRGTSLGSGNAKTRLLNEEVEAVPKLPDAIPKDPLDVEAAHVQRMPKRKSFMQLFGR